MTNPITIASTSNPAFTVQAHRMLSGHWQVRSAAGFGATASPSRDRAEAHAWIARNAEWLAWDCERNQAATESAIIARRAQLDDLDYQADQREAMSAYADRFGTANE